MKRAWLITIIICLVILGGGAAVLLLPQVVPFDQCSDVYKRYAKMDGVDATFIKDYKVNDTVFVDVTLLVATTDSAWLILQHDLNLKVPPQEMIGFLGHNFVEVWAAPKRDYSLPMDSVLLNNDLLAVSWSERRISVFSIETMQQMHSLKRNQFKESISKKSTIK